MSDSAPRAARALMVQGTGSGVGKSFLVAALCRAYAQRGVSVRPFKAQNMSNNAAVTADGSEIGRAQAIQARAARAFPTVDMNPILLKPMNDRRAEVVVHGRGRPELQQLPWHDRRSALWSYVTQSFERLTEEAELVVVEGAGSPAEINLCASDIVNMAVAREWDIPTLVVADIDRGGAFAALYGTWALLDPLDRALIAGFVLNKFRGDPTLLEPAPSELERLTGVPTVGVVPFERHLLPDEDAQTLERERGDSGPVVGAIRLPHLSNYDELDPLVGDGRVRLRWIVDPTELDDVVAVILPGSRNTIADLVWLRSTGLAGRLSERAKEGLPMLGLCGGLQMLGEVVTDPSGVEAGGEERGLGLLPIRTTLAPEKTTRLFDGEVDVPFLGGVDRRFRLRGYEIHHGRSQPTGPIDEWRSEEGRVIGYSHGSIGATYLHGFLENDGVRSMWLATIGIQGESGLRWNERIEAELDRVASLVAEAIDLDRLWDLAEPGR